MGYNVRHFLIDGDSSQYDVKDSRTEFGICSTPYSTAEKVVEISQFILETNGMAVVKFTNNVGANAKLNVNNTGAKDIYFHGSQISANIIKAGYIATFVYDGSVYHLSALDAGIAYGLVSTTNINLRAANWTGTEAPYQYDLGSNYVNKNLVVGLNSTNATAEQVEAATDAIIQGSSNSRYIYAWGDKPTVDIPVHIIYI